MTTSIAKIPASIIADQVVSPKTPVASPEQKKMREASEQFESVFLDMMLKAMRKTIPEGGGLMDGGNSEEIFRSMLDSEYTKVLAQQRFTGIASTIEKDLKKLMDLQSSGVPKEQVIKNYSGKDLLPK